MSADELTAKAKCLREMENYAEAILVAREATRAAPDDANAWWQLGLATHAHQGLAKALGAFKKTTELAPHFGSGWRMLGLAEAEVGQIEEAKESLRMAYEADSDLTIVLDKLAELSQQTSDEEQEFWALDHLAAVDNLSGYQCNRLGILHHNKGAYSQAIQFYRRCAIELDDAAGWINLGLVLSEKAVSQDADAVDVLRLGKHKYPTHDRFQKLLDGLVPRMLKLANDVRGREAPVLATHEYYQNYLNPIELLNLSDEDLDEIGAKEIQRAKRRLMQEIELEDGVISWMRNTRFDRSRALALCDEISSDKRSLQNHVLVYRDQPLRAFLSFGELEHFLVTPDDGHRDAQTAFEENWHGFGTWLSPIFAAQYNLVLGKALGQKDLCVVECLLDGRRWVQLQHEESCFEQARRVIDRLIENLEDLLRRFETEKGIAALVDDGLARGNLLKLLVMLPNRFSDQLSKTFYLIRSTSIDANNKYDDPEAALALLECTRPLAMKAPQLQHKFDEDWKKLKELSAERDKHSARLTMGGQPLEITPVGARFGERFIRAEEVTTLRWGALLNAGGRVGMTQYTLAIGADEGRTIKVEWTTKQSKEQDDHFSKLNFAALVYLMDHCIANLRKRMDDGERAQIGSTVATRDGLEVKIKGWFSDKNHIISWPDLKSEMQSGMLTFSDRTNAKATATIGMKDTDNAIVLFWMTNLKGKQ